MQIRAANRQDEALIRNIVFSSLEELGITPDPDGRDKDLKNVEQSFFWPDGACLVAERDGQVIGVVAARRHDHDEEQLELVRLAVYPAARNRGVGSALMKTLVQFASNMEYKQIVLGTDLPSADLARLPEQKLKNMGFDLSSSGWSREVPPRVIATCTQGTAAKSEAS